MARAAKPLECRMRKCECRIQGASLRHLKIESRFHREAGHSRGGGGRNRLLARNALRHCYTSTIENQRSSFSGIGAPARRSESTRRNHRSVAENRKRKRMTNDNLQMTNREMPSDEMRTMNRAFFTSKCEIHPSNFASLAGQLFCSTQIPVCLWFLAKNKNRVGMNSRFLSREDESILPLAA